MEKGLGESMLIGIDYDDTFTRDPDFFREMISLLHSRGHQAMIVTQRPADSKNEDLEKNIQGLVPIVYAGEKWKTQAVMEETGQFVHVWMDDCPQCVCPAPPLIGEKPDPEITKETINHLWKVNMHLLGETEKSDVDVQTLVDNNWDIIHKLKGSQK